MLTLILAVSVALTISAIALAGVAAFSRYVTSLALLYTVCALMFVSAIGWGWGAMLASGMIRGLAGGAGIGMFGVTILWCSLAARLRLLRRTSVLH